MAGDIDDLLAEATQRSNGGNICWARRITGKAAELRDQLEQLYAEDPYLVNLAGTSRAFKQLGVEITDVGYHFRGQCQCRN